MEQQTDVYLLNWIQLISFKTKAKTPLQVDRVVESIAPPATMFKHLNVNIKQTSI